jgi:hypothetical protein
MVGCSSSFLVGWSVIDPSTWINLSQQYHLLIEESLLFAVKQHRSFQSSACDNPE